MTYDVVRQRSSDGYYREDPKGELVLAADAEAHENAAVQAVMNNWRTLYEAQTKASRAAIAEVREQAIRDCIAAAEPQYTKEAMMAALRALLEKP